MFELFSAVYGRIDRRAGDHRPFTVTRMQSVDVRPPGAPPTANALAADLRLTPDGRFLYANERELSTIAAFAIDAEDGTLTKVGSYAAQPGMRCFSVDRAGRFLIAAGPVSGRVSVHAIDPARGGLTEVGVHDAGPGADWVEIVSQNHPA